jgi:hypothetical protein
MCAEEPDNPLAAALLLKRAQSLAMRWRIQVNFEPGALPGLLRARFDHAPILSLYAFRRRC